MGRVTRTAEKIRLQSNLVSWSEKWQMKLNDDKCKILYIGNNNRHTKYTMNVSELSKVSHEKELVKDFKPSKHCSDINQPHWRTFKHKSEKSYPYTV